MLTQISSQAAYFAQAADNSNDWLWGIPMVGLILIAIALVVLFIVSLFSILGSENYNAGGKALWALAVFAFPVLGPVVWFIWGRNSTF